MSYQNQSNQCPEWQLSNWLPIRAIVSMWCERNNSQCLEAKKLAIITAVENKDIEYRRNDGKTFDDSIHELEAKGILLINRKSFEDWIDTLDIPDNDKPITEKEREKLLKIIHALTLALSDKSTNLKKGDGNINASQIQKKLELYGLTVSESYKLISKALKIEL